MIDDSLSLEMMQGKRSPEDQVERLLLSYAGKRYDGQVPTLKACSFQMTPHLKADMCAK
jgi:hypothetical protein